MAKGLNLNFEKLKDIKLNLPRIDLSRFGLSKSDYLTTIAIDTERSTFHFYSMIGNDRNTFTHQVKSYSGGHFDDEFFNKFKFAVKEFTADTPSDSVRKITVVLPDSAIMCDTVKIPVMRVRAQAKKVFDITLGSLYRNYSELRVMSYVADQNKQYSTYAISAVQKKIISSIYAACSENKLFVGTLTFASNAAVGAALTLNPKLKNQSYLFLDMKDTYSRFVFVANGKTVGFYTLPFGLEFLRKDRITQEDMLFDHSYAELSVLNARERAKSKKLTIMALDNPEESEEEDIYSDDELEGEENTSPAENSAALGDERSEITLAADENVEMPVADGDITAGEVTEASVVEPTVTRTPTVKLFTRKAPRKLPKFMQREIPETREGILYENFRVFVKWALTLIHENKSLTDIGMPEFVLVNIPEELAFVLDMVNEESEENGISFTALDVGETSRDVTANLELYGGLFPRHINSAGKF